MKPHVLSLVLLGASALAGCNDPGFRGVPEVRIASAAEVAQCRPVSVITNEPGVYGPLVGHEAERYARNKILESAKDAGADTVVFDPVTPGEPVYLLRAQAYDC
ncbi:hypothetical protein [Rhodobacter lacus]|uniref:DUF4156 domain-containing protein n=1 Tax=Rhodobacter lacus TaxID=1641972 RepID=A0ABW5ADQ8_9RHOB